MDVTTKDFEKNRKLSEVPYYFSMESFKESLQEMRSIWFPFAQIDGSQPFPVADHRRRPCSGSSLGESLMAMSETEAVSWLWDVVGQLVPSGNLT